MNLPPGVPDALGDVARLRYALILLAVLWSVLRARRHPALALLVGLVLVLLAQGFWAMTLSRPYGLFLDPEITRCAGDVSVAAAGAAPPGEGLLVNEPGRCGLWAALARRLHPKTLLLVLPTLVPVLVLPTMGALICAMWPRREAFVASFLWLAFSTGDLETLRGVGFIPGLWTRPGSALMLLLLVAAVLAIAWLGLRSFTATVVGASLLSLWLVVRAPVAEGSLMETLLLLTLDQTPWWLLAAWAWRRGAAPSARALILGGAGLLIASAFPLGVDAWGAQAFYRLGLLLAAAGPVTELSEWVGAAVSRIPTLRLPPADLGAALLILLGAPICFLTWWTPKRPLMVLVGASQEPLEESLVTAMAWIREHTPPGSVFLASPDHAPSVAVLGGRRVLRAPTLGAAADEVRRERMENRVLSGRDPGRLADRYGLSHVFMAPGDFQTYGIDSLEDLGRRRRFHLLYADAADNRVYEINRSPRSSRGDPLPGVGTDVSR